MIKLGVTVPPGQITMMDYADQSFKKNARGALKRSSDELLKHVQYQLRRRRGPTPSAPGEPPAMQTGKLAKSFKRLRVKLRKGYGSSGVTSDHPGAYVLEWGSTVASRAAMKIGGRRGRRLANAFLRGLAPIIGGGVWRVAPRPYLGPASEEADPEITRILEAVVQ